MATLLEFWLYMLLQAIRQSVRPDCDGNVFPLASSPDTPDVKFAPKTKRRRPTKPSSRTLYPFIHAKPREKKEKHWLQRRSDWKPFSFRFTVYKANKRSFIKRGSVFPSDKWFSEGGAPPTSTRIRPATWIICRCVAVSASRWKKCEVEVRMAGSRRRLRWRSSSWRVVSSRGINFSSFPSALGRPSLPPTLPHTPHSGVRLCLQTAPQQSLPLGIIRHNDGNFWYQIFKRRPGLNSTCSSSSTGIHVFLLLVSRRPHPQHIPNTSPTHPALFYTIPRSIGTFRSNCSLNLSIDIIGIFFSIHLRCPATFWSAIHILLSYYQLKFLCFEPPCQKSG